MFIQMPVVNVDTIQKVSDVLNGHESMHISTDVLSEINAAATMLQKLYFQKKTSLLHLTMFVRLTEVYLYHFSKYTPETFIYFIRCITDKDVNITYKEVPIFRNVVRPYGKILRQARTIRG